MTTDTRESETLVVPYLRNVANAGRGSAMTEALHQAADAITAQAQEIAELRQREAGMREQHDRDSAELRRLCAERDEARRKAAELRERVERLSLAAIKARQALAHAAQFGPVYDTAYNDLDRAIEGATVTHTLPMAAQQPAK